MQSRKSQIHPDLQIDPDMFLSVALVQSTHPFKSIPERLSRWKDGVTRPVLADQVSLVRLQQASFSWLARTLLSIVSLPNPTLVYLLLDLNNLDYRADGQVLHCYPLGD